MYAIKEVLSPVSGQILLLNQGSTGMKTTKAYALIASGIIWGICFLSK
jgi:hypothetical protein